MDAGTPSERYLEQLCHRAFIRMWAFRSPYRLQRNCSTANQGKELCDLLAVFERDIFLFSDKRIAWGSHPDINVAWNRWYRHAIADSGRQLAGAERWVREYPDRIFLDKSCSKPLPVKLPDNDSARFHLIAVAHGAAEPCKQTFGGGSGSLLVNTIKGFSGPFAVGRIAGIDSFVHVFDEATLDIVFENLDTFPEFRSYLVAKEALLREGKEIVATGEEDLLALYLMSEDPHKQRQHGFGNTQGANVIAIRDGEWRRFERSSQKAARDAANSDSYLWDALIDRFAAHIMAGTQQFTSVKDPQQIEPLLRIMNAEERTARRLLAANCIEQMRRLGDRPYRVWVVHSPSTPGVRYTFLALRREPDEDYEAYRERRLHILTLCTALTRMQLPGASAYIGIGHGPVDNDNSEDLILIDEAAWSPELEEEARQFQQDCGIMRELRESRGKAFEYPITDPKRRPVGPDRNQPCPCGSGRKWKKCCGAR